MTKLIFYALHDDPPKVIPAPLERDWMNRHGHRHPYRCLPLAIGNCYGWQILLRGSVKATWNGGTTKADVVVESSIPHVATSNFTRGIVTFDVPIVFRTEPGYQLMVTGPTNEFKDGASPMTAIIESEWLSYTFTMNYQLTRPGVSVLWEKDEPFCQVAVVPALIQESVEPEWRRIQDDPKTAEELRLLSDLRGEFRSRQDRGDPEANKQGWQKLYFRGEHPDGSVEQTHQTKMKLRELKDLRQ